MISKRRGIIFFFFFLKKEGTIFFFFGKGCFIVQLQCFHSQLQYFHLLLDMCCTTTSVQSCFDLFTENLFICIQFLFFHWFCILLQLHCSLVCFFFLGSIKQFQISKFSLQVLQTVHHSQVFKKYVLHTLYHSQISKKHF